MNVFRRVITIISFVLSAVFLSLIAVAAFYYFQESNYKSPRSTAGPCYGDHRCGEFDIEYVNLSLDTLKFDYKLSYDSGAYILANAIDTLPITVVKLDKMGEVVWSQRINSAAERCSLKFKRLYSPTIDRKGKQLTFNYDDSWEFGYFNFSELDSSLQICVNLF